MYALMLTKSADLLGVFETEDAAKKALKKVKGADASLTDLAVVELDESGRPVSKTGVHGTQTEQAHSSVYEAIPA